MGCPHCGSNNLLEYSPLANGLVCVTPSCGLTVELDPFEIQMLQESREEVPELVCA